MRRNTGIVVGSDNAAFGKIKQWVHGALVAVAHINRGNVGFLRCFDRHTK